MFVDVRLSMSWTVTPDCPAVRAPLHEDGRRGYTATQGQNMPTPEQCNQAFDDAEEQFSDKSTEFLAQIAADNLGVEAHDIIWGMGQLADKNGVIPSSNARATP